MTHTDAYLKRLSERLAVVTDDAREGLPAEQTAERLKVSVRTVLRYRSQLGVVIEKPSPVPRHGTLSWRKNRNCKCPECRAVENAYVQSLRGKPVLSHGAAGYRRGCRCAVCFGYTQEANRLARDRRKARERGAA